ncbi:hypothetical protein, partial [Denitratimonas tolerans]
MTESAFAPDSKRLGEGIEQAVGAAELRVLANRVFADQRAVKPFRPSATPIRMSSTPRVFRSLNTR